MAQVLEWAGKPWSYTLKADTTCADSDSPVWSDNAGGTPILYGKALAYHLTGEEQYAAQVKNILGRITTQIKTIDLDEQGCRLRFGWGTPELVAAADLIEDYW